jgi:hypothetical protein
MGGRQFVRGVSGRLTTTVLQQQEYGPEPCVSLV